MRERRRLFPVGLWRLRTGLAGGVSGRGLEVAVAVEVR